MARAALALKVIGRFLIGVAGNAIRLPRMIKMRGQPGNGRVTCAALTLKVIGRFLIGMACNAIGLAGVIKRRGQPRIGGMAIAALSRKVIGRFVLSVASQTIGKARVIEVGRLPRTGRVTTAALTGIVIGGFIRRMARRAIVETRMIERCGLPGLRRVTRAALAGIVIGRRVLLMARHTKHKARVIEGRGLPCLGGVTRAAFARIVIGGRVHLMALLAIGEIGVIKRGRPKRHIGVTAFAGHTDPFKFAVMLICMATHACRRQPLRFAVDVTLIAVDLAVFTRKRRPMGGFEFRWKFDRARGNLHATRLIPCARQCAFQHQQQFADRDSGIAGGFFNGLRQPPHPIDLRVVTARLLPLGHQRFGA